MQFGSRQNTYRLENFNRITFNLLRMRHNIQIARDTYENCDKKIAIRNKVKHKQNGIRKFYLMKQ